jgi:uncharacterized phage protein (TIGR01671 family)
MSRIIKYKVWDKVNKKWIEQTGNPYIFPFEGRVAMLCAGQNTGHINTEDFSQYYEIVEYTERLDKNSKEIYESDLLLIPDTYKDRILDDGSGPEEPFDHIASVVFQKGSFGVEIKESGELLKSRFYTFCELDSGGVSYKVIGNIYENPELLKEVE